MRKVQFFAIALAGVVFAIPLAEFGYGQSNSGTQKATEGLKFGVYDQFDFAKKVKLGTAFLVNPQLVQNTTFLHLVEPTAVTSSDAHLIKARELLDSGELGIAQRQPEGAWKIYRWHNPKTSSEAEDLSALRQLMAKPDVKIASPVPTLFSVDSSNTVINWSTPNAVDRQPDAMALPR